MRVIQVDRARRAVHDGMFWNPWILLIRRTIDEILWETEKTEKRASPQYFGRRVSIFHATVPNCSPLDSARQAAYERVFRKYWKVSFDSQETFTVKTPFTTGKNDLVSGFTRQMLRSSSKRSALRRATT